MLNIGGGEVIVILLVALIVLGPAKLPDAVKQAGKALGELRKLSAGFQEEFSDVLDFSTEESARERGRASTAAAAEPGDPNSASEITAPDDDVTPDAETSPSEVLNDAVPSRVETDDATTGDSDATTDDATTGDSDATTDDASETT
jgi:sec-independent protein translocase protein TatB